MVTTFSLKEIPFMLNIEMHFADHCLLGDSTDLVDISTDSKTCKELVAQNPKYCSQTYYKDLCCESCGNVKDSGNKSWFQYLICSCWIINN